MWFCSSSYYHQRAPSAVNDWHSGFRLTTLTPCLWFETSYCRLVGFTNMPRTSLYDAQGSSNETPKLAKFTAIALPWWAEEKLAMYIWRRAPEDVTNHDKRSKFSTVNLSRRLNISFVSLWQYHCQGRKMQLGMMATWFMRDTGRKESTIFQPTMQTEPTGYMETWAFSLTNSMIILISPT